MAVAAVNMTTLGTLTPSGQQAACDEVLTRVDRSSPAASALLRTPDAASGSTHPFHFGSSTELDSFRTSILLWLATE